MVAYTHTHTHTHTDGRQDDYCVLVDSRDLTIPFDSSIDKEREHMQGSVQTNTQSCNSIQEKEEEEDEEEVEKDEEE